MRRKYGRIDRIKIMELEKNARKAACENAYPYLRNIFFELTQKCNEHCFHCGSYCAKELQHGLDYREYVKVLVQVKESCKMANRPLPFITVTGGEPLLYPQFFEFVNEVHKLGFQWGMTTNTTLVTKAVAKKLKDAGMYSMSTSIDGPKELHDRYRDFKGGYDKALKGLQNIVDAGIERTMITTVVNHENIKYLNDLFKVFMNYPKTTWRLTGLEPIGRALLRKEMLLTREDQKYLFDFMKEKRELRYDVTYGCTHYLGLDYELEVRDYPWYCGAGVNIAGILWNGDVMGCIDIPRNKKTIQGNILKRDFLDIWNNEFAIYRKPLSAQTEGCKGCKHEKYCRGGAMHSYDYKKNVQQICMKGILFGDELWESTYTVSEPESDDTAEKVKKLMAKSKK